MFLKLNHNENTNKFDKRLGNIVSLAVIQYQFHCKIDFAFNINLHCKIDFTFNINLHYKINFAFNINLHLIFCIFRACTLAKTSNQDFSVAWHR